MTNEGYSEADLLARILEDDGDMGPTLACPHCSFENKDPWEVLAQGRIDEMHCEQCRKPFAFALMDCDHCGVEKGFTWPHRPGDITLNLLSCESCGRLYRQPHESSQQEINPEGL